jgi:hypothetical protein
MKITTKILRRIILEELREAVAGQPDLHSYEYAGYMSVLQPDQFGGGMPRQGTPEYDAFMKGYDAAMADRQGGLEEADDGWRPPEDYMNQDAESEEDSPYPGMLGIGDRSFQVDSHDDMDTMMPMMQAREEEYSWDNVQDVEATQMGADIENLSVDELAESDDGPGKMTHPWIGKQVETPDGVGVVWWVNDNSGYPMYQVDIPGKYGQEWYDAENVMLLDQSAGLAEEDDALDGAAFDGWTDDQAQRTYRSMGGDFDKVVDKADDFADDPHAYAAMLQKKATGKWPTEEADDYGDMPELSEEDEAEPRHLSLVRDEPQGSESVTAQLSGDPDGDMEGYESPEDLASLYAALEEEGLTPGEEAEDAARYQDNWREFTRQGKYLSVVEHRLLRFFSS